jgi:four helix bundle protein
MGSGSEERGSRGAVAISSYRDLRVWQAGMDLVEDVYRMTAAFPQAEVYGLASQMQRAAISVPSNIAEGHTRSYTREYLHHVAIAHASVAELETQIEIAVRLGYVGGAEAASLIASADALSRQLNALRAALAERLARSPIPDPRSSIPDPRSRV